MSSAITLREKKEILDGRLVDIQNQIQNVISAVNLKNYDEQYKEFDMLEELVESARDLLEDIEDMELTAMAEELEDE